jgi:hypothetical protein
MPKAKGLRERAWATALRIWPGLKSSPWIRPNVEAIYIAGHRANRLTAKEREKLVAWGPVVAAAIRWHEDDTGDDASDAALRAAVKQLYRAAAKSVERAKGRK